MSERVLVTGAGGFIGHHLIKFLSRKGYWVRGADIKLPEYESSPADEFLKVDLRDPANCARACDGIKHVYHLAADMGGIGYISGSHAEIVRSNTKMNLFMLESAQIAKVERFFFSSTACVYPLHMQKNPDIAPLKESDAYPAQPEEGYGWEKLYMEKLCQYFREDYNLATRVARFHNVYGPLGTWDGGREKAPAATCRKVAEAKDGGTITVWGDGKQTRSFMYVDDCCEGVYRLMMSDFPGPINIGTEEMITVSGLVELVSEIAGKRLDQAFDTTRPQGVRGRNSDNTLIREILQWEPSIPLKTGLVPTYQWINSQVQAKQVPQKVTYVRKKSDAPAPDAIAPQPSYLERLQNKDKLAH